MYIVYDMEDTGLWVSRWKTKEQLGLDGAWTEEWGIYRSATLP